MQIYNTENANKNYKEPKLKKKHKFIVTKKYKLLGTKVKKKIHVFKKKKVFFLSIFLF